MARDRLSEGQLEAIRPYIERLRIQAPPEGSNSSDSIVTMADTSMFPGAVKVHVAQLGRGVVVDVAQSGGKVTTHKVAGR